MRVGVIQLCSGADIDCNLKEVEYFIRAAASGGAELIVTPEMTHIGQRNPQKLLKSIYKESEDPGVNLFSALAKELSVNILIGSLAIKANPNKAVNRSFLFDAKGAIKARYDKIHLFDVKVSKDEIWKESNLFKAGGTPVIVDVKSARIGLSICYDLRFPYLYRGYAQSNANILSIPAAFTVPTGKAHWEVLLRARAIENGAFVIAPAQVGLHEDGRSTYGNSMIIGPWGNILSAIDNKRADYLCCDIDLRDVNEVRKNIPSLSHSVSLKS